MKLYSIAWLYHSEQDGVPDDSGVCHDVFAERYKAEECLTKCAEDDFNQWTSEGCLPDMIHENDWAMVEDEAGNYYEYRIDEINVADGGHIGMLIGAIKKYTSLIDEEMEHGDYHVNEYSVPKEFENEEDYYGRHWEIVNDASNARTSLDSLVRKLEKEVA